MPKIITAHTIARSVWWATVLELFRQSPFYIWGGADPRIVVGEKRWPTGGLDCNHFAFTYPLFLLGGPDLRSTHNTDLTYADLEPVELASQLHCGDLVFYQGAQPKGPGDVEHVMVYAGGGAVLGMSWGGSANTTVEYSRKHDHRARVHQSIDYRPGRCGYRRVPVVD